MVKNGNVSEVLIETRSRGLAVRALNNNNRAGYKVSSLLFKTRTAVVQLIVSTFQKTQ